VVSRENCHAVPGTLPLPDRFAPESSKGIRGKGSVLRLELLETDHVRLSLANQAKRLSSRLLMLLMLKVAILTESRCVDVLWVRIPRGATEVGCSDWHYFTGGKKWKAPN
jgi:hypothetical protein